MLLLVVEVWRFESHDFKARGIFFGTVDGVTTKLVTRRKHERSLAESRAYFC